MPSPSPTPPPDPPQWREARDDSDCRVIERLAREIWTEHYAGIVAPEQVEYMLETLQSAAAIRAQMESGMRYFLARAGVEADGYLALLHRTPPGWMHISKLYVRSASRGRGWGRSAIAFALEQARADGTPRLWLTVNKHNPTVAVYQRLGFRIAAEVVKDIGRGFVMDDYRMVWAPFIDSPQSPQRTQRKEERLGEGKVLGKTKKSDVGGTQSTRRELDLFPEFPL